MRVLAKSSESPPTGPRPARGLRRVVVRSGVFVVGGMVLGLLAGLVALSRGEQGVVAEARVLVAAPASARASGERAGVPAAAEPMQPETRLILSRDLARTAIRGLDITLDNLVPDNAADPLQRLMRAVGLLRPPRDVPDEDRLLAAFTERLSVRADGPARQVLIGFRATDGALAARAANRVASLYVALYAPADGGGADDVRVLSPAAAPEGPAPRAPRSILAGFALLGIGVSAGLATLNALRSGRSSVAISPEIVERPQVPGEVRLMTRVANAVTEDRKADPHRIADEAPGAVVPNFALGSAVDETEGLVARIVAAGATAYARRILVTHMEDHVDCASSALQLARALGLHGRAILVGVGAGDRAQALNDPRPAPGLSDLLDGTASFSEVIHRDAGSRLHILPSGKGLAPAGADLDLVLDALSQTYDFVVLSATLDPGQPARALALALAPEADYVMLACSGQSGDPEMSSLQADLLAAGAGEVVAVRAGLRPQAERAAA
jgi:Mrp family chromosome partitioning ATPase